MSNQKQAETVSPSPKHHSLTLAIPTYNRAEIVTKNLKDIIEKKLNHYAHVLIIDNCSQDRTYEQLVEIAREEKGIEIVKQDYNSQIFGNVISLIEYCKTGYILINSDEDHFEKEGVKWVYNYIQENSPSFISGAVCFYDTHLYRSANTNISTSNIRKFSNYGSGLLYNAYNAKQIIPLLEENKNNEVVWLYPMFAIALAVFLYDQNCFSTETVLSNKKGHAETQIEDRQGGKYYNLESRISQLRALKPLAQALKAHFNSSKSGHIDRWLTSEYRKTFSLIRNSLKKENDPQLLVNFDYEAKNFYCKRTKRLLSKAWKKALSFVTKAN